MSYEDKWKILSDLLMEIQKMKEKIPSSIMDDLRSAKTIIQVLKRDPTNTKSITRVEIYLKNVESYAISIAEKIDATTVQEWLKRINKTSTIKQEKTSKLVVTPKVPRNKKWIRIKKTNELSLENVQKISEKCGLSVKVEENGDVLILGDEKSVKSFVKNIAKQFQDSRKG